MDDYEEYMSLEDEEEDYNYDSSDNQLLEEESDLQHVSFRESTSQVITKESLIAAQKEILVRVMEFLSVKEKHARILLIHYQWNVDKLFSVYADRGKDHLFACAGLTVFDPCLAKSKRTTKKMTCGICMEDDIPSNVMTRMECGHSYCNDCWKGHFTVKINEGRSKMITCMAHKCNAICDEDVVRKLVKPELAEKFDRYLVESYVEDNRMVKWCPSTPHCGNAMRKLQDDDGYDEVECSCGLQFCFSCLCESHSPCSCLMWKLWNEKCVNESESINWITINTRACPKCCKAVQKRDGCNHITCVCGQTFCWLCGGATGRAHSWHHIEGHSCGRYKDEDVRNLERAKRDLDRYTHYHYRFKAHTESLKLEDKLRQSVTEKAEANFKKKNEDVFKNCLWVTDAVNRLFRSRRIIKNSYPFAFYMFGEELFKDEMSNEERETKKCLFEDQQQQLEGLVEKLSEILEKPFDGYDYEEFKEMKRQLIDMCDLVDSRCKKMYDCIENDLLGPIQVGIHNITPYRSQGIEKAAEFCADIGQSSSN